MKRPRLLIFLLFLWLYPLQALCGYAVIKEQATVKEQMTWLHERFDVNFIYDSALNLDIPYSGRPMAEVAEAGECGDMELVCCLDALFEGTGISWEKNRKYIVLTKGRKKPKDYDIFIETRQDTLEEARITSMMDRRRNSTQTGLERIEAVQFRRGFAPLSAPDVLKTLQNLPGVAGGTELLNGLYVRGGTGSDNIYSLDGVPLYGVSHLAGLYSSFNTDVTDVVNFYKSGFPARYGGRLSSVVDVGVRDGNMTEYKGSATIGLINGSVQFEGPIVKDKTSFNVGLRRSWLDVLSVPGFAIYNKLFKSDMGARYAMTDLNAKLTHMLNQDSHLRLNLYTGRDIAGFAMDYAVGAEQALSTSNGEDYKLRWGNVLVSLSWDSVLGEGTHSDMKLYYTGYRSKMDWDIQMSERYERNDEFRSSIHELGFEADFDKCLTSVHRLRYGAESKMYIYAPKEVYNFQNLIDGGAAHSRSDCRTYSGNEAAVYAEDEMTLLPWLNVNAGLRAVLFGVKAKAYLRLEPRAAVCMKASDVVSFKLSYAEMNQFSHRLVTSYIDLPTCIWMPSTANIAPMNSRQLAAGVYFALPGNLSLDVEAFHKTLNHIREYKGYDIFPPINGWEQTFVPGKGRAYGLELGLSYNTVKTQASASYTLSKSERLFEDLYPTWFPDRYDNRNHLNLSINHRFNKKLEMYGGWTYHTGNRLTMQSQYVPGEHSYDDSFHTSPNNVMLPDYHRLDLGFNFHKTTKGGNEAVWNLSVYNLYCRMNPIFLHIRYGENGKASYIATGIIPIIPTFSYTIRF